VWRSGTAAPAATTSSCRWTACWLRPACTTPRPISSSASKAAGAGGLELAPPALKRAPRGYAIDHARIDRLRLKELAVYRRHPLEPWLHEPACEERVRSELESARPLVTWLRKHVGPPSQSRAD
jgi:uncharacterized protein (DUF2461 family)